MIEDSLLNDESSADLMVVNLTNAFSMMKQQVEEEGTTDRYAMDHKIEMER